jgi:hypothetical protein
MDAVVEGWERLGMRQESRLSFSEILTMSERESGAYGLGDQSLLRRVETFVDWINGNGPFTVDQIREMRQQIKDMLTRRLRISLDRQRFPGIAEESIAQPVFIIGFARSGTTLLHSLLAEDPAILKLQEWHMYSPSPPPGAGHVAQERYHYATRQIEKWMDFCPAHKQLHPYVDKGAFQLIEDEEAFSLDFRSAYPWHFFRVPCLEPSLVLLSDNQADAFRFHRSLLQHLQWNTGMKRWVCKGPSAQMHLDSLFEVYPDALCIWAHRPLAEIYASNVAIRAVTYDAIQGRPIDWSSQAKAHAERMKAAVDRLISSDLIDDPRILHLSFRQIAADPLAVVKSIYAKQGREMTGETESRIAQWLENPENSADRFGRYPYAYEPFGLDRAWIEELFADYSHRFGLA